MPGYGYSIKRIKAILFTNTNLSQGPKVFIIMAMFSQCCITYGAYSVKIDMNAKLKSDISYLENEKKSAFRDFWCLLVPQLVVLLWIMYDLYCNGVSSILLILKKYLKYFPNIYL